MGVDLPIEMRISMYFQEGDIDYREDKFKEVVKQIARDVKCIRNCPDLLKDYSERMEVSLPK